MTIGLLSACGGSDDATPVADTAENSSDAGTPTPAPDAEDAAAPADQPSEQPATGSGNATLSLDNGESYDFDVLCVLEPQMAAGSEILFTATSMTTPGIDLTQFGDEGTVTDIASISMFDDSYEVVWEANSLYDLGGGGVELSLNGSTITGTGTFYADGDISGEGVQGEVVANC